MPNSLIDAIERFLKWAYRNRAAATADAYGRHLRKFAAQVGDIDPATLTPATVENYAQTFHPVQAIQRLLGWMHRVERSIALNPLQGMRKIPTGKRRRICTRREVVAMLRDADAPFRRYLLALRETMARPQEVRAVRFEDLRQPGGLPATAAALVSGRAFFELHGAKGFRWRADDARERIIPISPRLGRLLLRLIRETADASGLIFANSLAKPWTANAVRCRMRRLRERVHLGTDRRGERVVAYSFRHTGATAAAAAGLRDWTLAEVLGHASTRTTDRYVHLQAADLIDAMKRVWEAKTSERVKIDRTGSTQTRPQTEG